ncbi:hypothetical protein BaRGS_00008943 [Batillaria attramentaria]|uniref:Uncharacterized protein n=1 Tax=Batillaria attramentaria TaxID=370345 RepID=A0ABD0LKK7_9CAEN
MQKNRLGTTSITINKTMSESKAMPQEPAEQYDYVTAFMLSEAWEDEDETSRPTNKTLKEAAEGFESLKTAADAMALAAGKNQIPPFLQPPELRLQTKGNPKLRESTREKLLQPIMTKWKEGVENFKSTLNDQVEIEKTRINSLIKKAKDAGDKDTVSKAMENLTEATTRITAYKNRYIDLLERESSNQQELPPQPSLRRGTFSHSRGRPRHTSRPYYKQRGGRRGRY